MNFTTGEASTLCWKRISIPKGLPTLLETLAKETIRENPEDIVRFLSKLLEDLIAKRDQDQKGSNEGSQSDKGKPDEENPLLPKNKQHLSTVSDEELAASKIQAGFRGYQTRKSLKSKKKGGDLSLTSLTPLNQDDDDTETDEESERKRLEKAADEAIAAEIKTPLETIREESVDGSFRLKSPESIKRDDTSEQSKLDKKLSIYVVEALEGISEEGEKVDLLEIHENLTAELEVDNTSLYDAESESLDNYDLETNFKEETEGEMKLMDRQINEVLNSSPLGEDDQASVSPSPGGSDIKGTSVEIHESEVETLMDSENVEEKIEVEEQSKQTRPPDTEEVDMESKIQTQFSEEHVEESLTKVTEKPEIDEPIPTEAHQDEIPETKTETENKSEEETPIAEAIQNSEHDEIPKSETTHNSPEHTTPSTGERGEKEFIKVDAKQDELFPETDASSPKNEVGSLLDQTETEDPEKSTNTNAESDDLTSKTMHKDPTPLGDTGHIAFIDDEKVIDRCMPDGSTEVASELCGQTPECPNNVNNVINVELPSLSKSERPSFANTDSASSSTTTVTVRPADFEKNENSSQDASSLSETPIPKPRKPASASAESKSSVDEVEDLKQKLPATTESKESKEILDDLKSSVESEPPVLRRQKIKSTPKSRGKAVASKYRSGIVMDDEVSMEEMEAQIEHEMMSQAATKIQAGFRGYKTRKSIRHSGVSFADEVTGNKKAKRGTKSEEEVDTAPSASAAASDPSATGLGLLATASASADSIATLAGKKPPPLAFLRSRSYPGSHDGVPQESDENEYEDPNLDNVDLDYDPAYVNRAATKIQASVRGYLVRKSFRNNKKGNRNVHSSGEGEGVGDDDEIENNPAGLLIHPANRGSVSPISDVESEQAATKIQAAFRGFKDRQKMQKTKKAVVTIQATVRGFLTRRRLTKLRRYINSPCKEKRRSMQRRRSSGKSMMSPEVQKIKKDNDAATKIQAVYRGYQVRSKIKKSGNDE